MGMDAREDLALLRVADLRSDAAARRLVREARLTRRPVRPSPLRTAVGIPLVRAGIRLGGEAPNASLSRPPVR
jgi:hypothetical protein